MSFLSRVFGGKKEEKGPTPSEAIQNLRGTEELLMKKQDFLEKKIETEIATARKNGTKNKRAAIAALKRKKRYEKQLAQIDGTLSQIEMQREALEGASTNAQVITAMKEAADAMKLAHKDLDVDKVHELTDDIAEQNEVAAEISDAISKAVGLEQDVDEDELEKELEDLEQMCMLRSDVDKVHDIMDDIAEQQDVSREITEAITNSVAFQNDVDEDELEKELEDLEQEDLDRELIGVNAPEDKLPEVPTGELVRDKPKPARAKPSEDDDEFAKLQSWAT